MAARKDSDNPEADHETLRAVALQVYRRLQKDNRTAPAAYGFAAMVIRNTLGCELRICCELLDDWLEQEEGRPAPRRKK